MLSGPRNDARHEWTVHVRGKMRQYRLSEYLVKRIMSAPERTEEGVADHTVAVMRRAGIGGRAHEMWVMYRKKGFAKLVISAWRYPGKSPIGKPIMIPQDALDALAHDEV